MNSLLAGPPDLFTHLKYPELNIFISINSLDSCLVYLKELTEGHLGSIRNPGSKIILMLKPGKTPIVG